MPRRPRSHEIEDLARDRIRCTFNSMGWTVEDLRKDYGEDLLVRIFDAGVATPLMFFVQCKGTDHIENYFSGNNTEIQFPVKRRHLAHWERFWEPIILAVWDSKSDCVYWECVQSYLSSYYGKTALAAANEAGADTLRIPVANTLDGVGLARIGSITRIRFQRFEIEKNGAQMLVEVLEKQLNLKIEYDPRAEIVIITVPGEQPTFVFCGSAAEEILSTAQHMGCPPEEAPKKAMVSMLRLMEKEAAQGKDTIFRSIRNELILEQRGEDPDHFPEHRNELIRGVLAVTEQEINPEDIQPPKHTTP